MKSAKEIVKEAEIIITTAGAGMGVDSGLPDFRGNEGMWKAYPALSKRKISFSKIARPNIMMFNDYQFNSSKTFEQNIRVNPKEAQYPESSISIEKGALDAIFEDLVDGKTKKVFF
jgi:NAD-dependent SIR2 family protein deacetylase